jgi:prophage regulatory protein
MCATSGDITRSVRVVEFTDLLKYENALGDAKESPSTVRRAHRAFSPPRHQILRDTFPMNQFLRLPAVLEATGLSRSTLYRLARAGEFPRSVKMRGSRAPVWLRATVHAWIQSQIDAAVGAQTPTSTRDQDNGGSIT